MILNILCGLLVVLTSRSSKCIGDSGVSCRNLQRAQSMPSMLVPLFRPRTVKSRPELGGTGGGASFGNMAEGIVTEVRLYELLDHTKPRVGSASYILFPLRPTKCVRLSRLMTTSWPSPVIV